MIIIHNNLNPLPFLNYLRLILVILPLVRTSESDSQDFSISSDQLFHNEPQIIIENDNDPLLQEAFDPSKLNEFKTEDKRVLNSINSNVNQNPSNDSLDITNKEATNDNTLTADDNSTMQKLPKSETLKDIPNTYKIQPVKSDLQPNPENQYNNNEPLQLQQHTKLNNDETLLNQVPFNQQKYFDHAKDIKLPQLPKDPKIHWEFPSVSFSLPRDQYLSDPSFNEGYYPSYDDSFDFDRNIEHKKDSNNYWMNANQGHNVLGDIPYNSTKEQFSNKLNPLIFWFDEASNPLSPHVFPQLQHYNGPDIENSERHRLLPNGYQNTYYPGNPSIGNQPNIYKPLDSETFSELSLNKNSIPDPLNGMSQYSNNKILTATLEEYPEIMVNQPNIYKPLDSEKFSELSLNKNSIPDSLNGMNQYSNNKILTSTLEEYPDTIIPDVLLTYNGGNSYQKLPKDQDNEIKPLYNVPLDQGFETDLVYYDPIDVSSNPQLTYYAPFIGPNEVYPRLVGKDSKSHSAYNGQIDQGRNYQKAGDYLHHIPIYEGSNIAKGDNSPHNYPIDRVMDTLLGSDDSHNFPIDQSIKPQVDVISINNPIDQERKIQATSDDSQISLKYQTINTQADENNAINPISQKHNPEIYTMKPNAFPKGTRNKFYSDEEFTANIDSTTVPNDDDLHKYHINNKTKPQEYRASSHNIPIDLVIEIHGNTKNSYDKSKTNEHVPNEINDYPNKVPIEQITEIQPFDNPAYNVPVEQVNLTKDVNTNEQSPINVNNQKFISQKSINEVMNEPWAWFSEHPGVKELRQTLNSDMHLGVNNQNNIDKYVQLPIEHPNDIEYHKNIDSGGTQHKNLDLGVTQQNLFDYGDVDQSYTTIDPAKIDKDNTISGDKDSDENLTQGYSKQFSKDKSNSFGIDALFDKTYDIVTPSLLLSRIFDEVLQQVDDNEQDINSKTSALYDFINDDIGPSHISDIDTTYILEKVLADQIKLWDNPEIYINQPLNVGHINQIDQHIRNDPPQISHNNDHISNIAVSQDYYADLSIEEMLSQMHNEPVYDTDPPLIPIDLSGGIRQSAGNTTNSNSPYFAVDYDSPVRYSTFWNPLDLPFGYSSYYILFDLKTIYTVTKMYIMNYGDMVHDITAFKLEVWDGHSKWRKLSNFFCQAGKRKHQEFGGFIGTGRYWKFTATKTSSGYQPWLVEVGFHGLEDYGDYLDYLDVTSSNIPTEPLNSSASGEKLLGDTVVAKQTRDGPLHIPNWIYYLVGLVVLALALLSMSCLIIHMAKKRNGLYNITLVMGKGKEDSVTSKGCHPTKDYTASAPPALPPASSCEAEVDSKTGV